MEKIPRVIAIHDLSGFGRCALTTALPVLAVMGIEVSPLPTSILSAHSAFPNFSFLDCTENMEEMIRHWEELDLPFNCIYSGFLGSKEQIHIVSDFIDHARKKKDILVVVDPVMGDNGRAYSTYTEEMIQMMGILSKKGDVITPNLTEACFLLSRPYRDDFTKEELMEMAVSLSNEGKTKVVVTGVTLGDESYNVGYEADGEGFFRMPIEIIDGHYPGTGDLFTSVLTGRLLKGDTFKESVSFATEYLSRTAAYTYERGTPEVEGPLFEQTLKYLID